MAEALVESGRVDNIADLFTLTAADIAALPVGDGSRQVGQKVAEKIVDGIEKAKSQSLARVITSLGIRKTGRTMGRRLAAHFNSLKALREASIADLTAVEGIGSEKAAYIHAGLISMADVIDRLEAFGVTSSQEVAVVATTSSLPLAGKKVVVTGTVPGLSRTEAQEAVEALGGAASGSVSKSTDLVVIGDGAGSKAEKAEALGVKIMPAEEFAALVAAHKG